VDRYQIFGIFALLLSVFLIVVFTNLSTESVLYIGGLVYALVFIFHRPLERVLMPWIKRPLFAYGVFIVLNGLFIETLAYLSNLDRIHAGEKVFLFASSSLCVDLLIGLPYYLSFALLFAWAMKRYDLSTFQLGLIIWFAQASSTDMFSHFIPLFIGGVPGVVGFILAGFTMLFTLHTPTILFDNRLREAYPNRSNSWLKYPVVIVMQVIPIIVTFIIAFVSFNLGIIKG